MTLNREWHLKNKMSKNPTEEQRLEWHLEHSKNCKCREMPDNLKEELKRLGKI